MTFTFQSLAMLFGLAALAIPIIVHLLNRRRHDVVAWGAMQFLEVNQTTRRRLWLEELLLMLLRMGVIAVFVLALAAPVALGPWFNQFADLPRRDIVLLIDGSASMGRLDGQGKTTQDAAQAWATRFAGASEPGDRVAVYIVQERATPVVPDLSPIREFVEKRLERLPAPRGSTDWPRALDEAVQLLAREGRNPRREIYVIHDGQRWGWADSDTLPRWEKVGTSFRHDKDEPRPAIKVVNVAPPTKRPPANYALAPLRPSRSFAWVGQNIAISSALVMQHVPRYQPPYRIRVEVDGKEQPDLPVPSEGAQEQIPIAFQHRFTTSGSHVVSMILEPELPLERRQANYRLKDHFPGDNRQDLAIEVLESLPILIIDGDKRVAPDSSSRYIERALKPKQPPIAHTDFTAAHLQGKARPRVVILADVPRLTEEQQQALETFVADGGGVLFALGERVDQDYYNSHLYRDGHGLLPGRLEVERGDAAKPESAASPDLRRFEHPALTLFKDEPNCTLGQARLPRWWQVTPADKTAAAVAWLTSDDPFLIERSYYQGKVMLATVPLDRTWNSTLPGVVEFPILLHELVYYLADVRSTDWNVTPGQPLRYRPEPGTNIPLPAKVTLHTPDRETHAFRVNRWPWTFDDTLAPGTYKLHLADKIAAQYVVHADPREADLTPCTAADYQRVAAIVPMQHGDVEYSSDVEGEVPFDLWWLFLLVVVMFLCAEVWMTRRMVAERET